MLDNPDEHEIYPTTQAYNELEELLKKVRLQAIGWTWAEACCQLDDGKDPRKYEVPELLPRAERDLTTKSVMQTCRVLTCLKTVLKLKTIKNQIDTAGLHSLHFFVMSCFFSLVFYSLIYLLFLVKLFSPSA